MGIRFWRKQMRGVRNEQFFSNDLMVEADG